MAQIIPFPISVPLGSVRALALELRKSVPDLLVQLEAAGVQVNGANSALGPADKILLLKYLQKISQTPTKNVSPKVKNSLLEKIQQKNSRIDDCREGLRIIGTEHAISQRASVHFVKESLLWRHPKSGIIRAPKFAENLVQGAHGWEISLGANKFYVELAVKKLVGRVDKFLDYLNAGPESDSYGGLYESLKRLVPTAVGNFRGELYASYTTDPEGRMWFGPHAVSTLACVNVVVSTARLDKHFSK